MKKKYNIIICDDSYNERQHFYKRQYNNFKIYGVQKRGDKFIETNPIDSISKLDKIIQKLYSKNDLPDLVLLDLFYKREIDNISELENSFIKKIVKYKSEFKNLKNAVNIFQSPEGINYLKHIRTVENIPDNILPISIYTDKNFNYLNSSDFNELYRLNPDSLHKDRDFEDPASMITADSEYMRIIRIIEKHKFKNPKLKIFITHGKPKLWKEVARFVKNILQIEYIELENQPNHGRTIIQKLVDAGSECNYAIIVMTGDDYDESGSPKARENVMHEIGFFQGKYNLNRVCIIYERGTSIPTNLKGVAYLPFTRNNIKSVFPKLKKELKNTLL